jgi:light-regulated signal transduction histidine kinase (bacteriophytochrome)
MRALTGYDRVTLVCGEQRAESSRGAFPSAAASDDDLPMILSDAAAPPVPLFPRDPQDSSADDALMHACTEDTRAKLANEGVRACLRVPFRADGIEGEFRCDSRTPREAHVELHAAAELFAQLFAMRCEIDQLRKG